MIQYPQIIKEKITEEINNQRLPVCMKYFEEHIKSIPESYAKPTLISPDIQGQVEIYLRSYYKPISRPSLAPYMKYE